jgi:heme/copper-type cytochrome/quinol oxidase subunit 2
MKDRIWTIDKLIIGTSFAALLLAGILIVSNINQPASASGTGSTNAPAATPVTYTPQTRSFVMTIVPYWVHEVTGTYDYLAPEFNKGGLLANKEVWGFSPSTIAVYQGDTVKIHLYNPSSDPHTWSIPKLNVNADVKAPAKTIVKFVADKVGVFTFNCEVGEHFPFMAGQLIVLPDAEAPGA